MLKLKIHIPIMKRRYSDRKSLRAMLRRSFANGVGSIVSLPGNYIQYPHLSSADDAARIRGDWQRVGEALTYASRKI